MDWPTVIWVLGVSLITVGSGASVYILLRKRGWPATAAFLGGFTIAFSLGFIIVVIIAARVFLTMDR